jgi:hypothetical protein
MTFRPPSRVLACPSLVPFSRFPHALVVAHRLFPRHLFTRQMLLRRIGLPCLVNNSIGSIRLNETDRGIFAASSLWGKFGGLYACGATFPHTVPPPNIFVTHLFSKQILKRKDFQEIVRLTWAQEVRGSNPRAPTKSFSIRNLQKSNFSAAALRCNLGTSRKIPKGKQRANFA